MTFVSCDSGDTVQTEPPLAETSGDITDEPTDSSDAEEKTVINAMSYNIWGGNADKITTANDGTPLPRMTVLVRGAKINAMLNGEDIDVAGFQEVSNRTDWANASYNWIGTRLDEKYGYIVGQTQDIGSGAYIIYKKDRFEVLDSGVFCLTDGAPASKTGVPQKLRDSDFERICNWAVFKVKETGEIFLFMDTHLAAGLCKTAASDATPSKVRAAQTKILVSQIPVLRNKVKTGYGVSDCPVILVGDMNSNSASNEYSIITKTLQDSLKVSKGKSVDEKYDTYTGLWHCKGTWDYKAKGDARIDFVFVSKEGLSVLNYKMIHTSTNLCPYGEYMSDHNAVIARLELS